MIIVALCMIGGLAVIAWTLHHNPLTNERFLRDLARRPERVGMMNARRRHTHTIVFDRAMADGRLEIFVELSRSSERATAGRAPVMCVRATYKRKLALEGAPDLSIPGKADAADVTTFSLDRSWRARVGWLDLTPTLSGFLADEVPTSAVLNALWPEHGERLNVRLSSRPIGLVRAQIDSAETVLQWHIYPDTIVEQRSMDARCQLLRTLIEQVEPLDAQLRQGLATPTAIACALLDDERLMLPLRRCALSGLLSHDAEVVQPRLEAFVRAPTLRSLELWFGAARGAVRDAIADAQGCRAFIDQLSPPGTYMTDTQRGLLAWLAARLQGVESVWHHPHNGLPGAIIATLCSAPQSERDASIRQLVAMIRAQGHPEQLELLLRPRAEGVIIALTTLDAEDTRWLEQLMITTLRRAMSDQRPDDALADRAAHVLRVIGGGESIMAIQSLIAQTGALQLKRKNMLTTHLSMLTARLGDRVNPGALTVVGDAPIDGALTLAQDHGALSLSEDTSARAEVP